MNAAMVFKIDHLQSMLLFAALISIAGEARQLVSRPGSTS